MRRVPQAGEAADGRLQGQQAARQVFQVSGRAAGRGDGFEAGEAAPAECGPEVLDEQERAERAVLETAVGRGAGGLIRRGVLEGASRFRNREVSLFDCETAKRLPRSAAERRFLRPAPSRFCGRIGCAPSVCCRSISEGGRWIIANGFTGATGGSRGPFPVKN